MFYPFLGEVLDERMVSFSASLYRAGHHHLVTLGVAA